MNKINQSVKTIQPASRNLRLGFVPLTDCAPLVMAAELGLFKKYGLKVELTRELGWATIRDKIIYRELDAAHALAAMPAAITLGLGSIACDCLTAMVLNLNGNAITFSNDLWKRGVRDGKTLREEIIRSRREKIYTFGVVFPFSSHRHLLRKWFAAHGIDADRDVRIVVVPPPQMPANLKAGHLDGFCAGEPWNSVAVQSHAGWIAATSAELDPHHPEKVLMVRNDFAAERQAEHLALIAALLEACEFCDRAENCEQLAQTLARPGYIGVSPDILRQGLSGNIGSRRTTTHHIPDFYIFNRDGANEPSGEKAAWVFELLRTGGLVKEPSGLSFPMVRKVFRADIFRQATSLRPASPPPSEHEFQTISA